MIPHPFKCIVVLVQAIPFAGTSSINILGFRGTGAGLTGDMLRPRKPVLLRLTECRRLGNNLYPLQVQKTSNVVKTAMGLYWQIIILCRNGISNGNTEYQIHERDEGSLVMNNVVCSKLFCREKVTAIKDLGV